MSITLQDGRQYPLVAIVPFSFADFDADGVAELAAEIPGSALEVELELEITTAFDSVTSGVIDVGDGTTDDAYVAAQDAKTVGGSGPVAVSKGVLGAIRK